MSGSSCHRYSVRSGVTSIGVRTSGRDRAVQGRARRGCSRQSWKSENSLVVVRGNEQALQVQVLRRTVLASFLALLGENTVMRQPSSVDTNSIDSLATTALAEKRKNLSIEEVKEILARDLAINQ